MGVFSLISRSSALFVCRKDRDNLPIVLPFPIRNLTQREFDEVDAVVMRCAYASQNALGRLCEERVYENDLAARLRSVGLSEVHTQFPIQVVHQDFAKEYRLDLIADQAPYELKTVAGFVGKHDAQVFHYAMMLGVNHFKLLNFRQAKVNGVLRFNAVLAEQRHQPVWNLCEWRPLTPACEMLQTRMAALIADWGTHLDSYLYEEALTYFCGGESACLRRVPVARDALQLGTHQVRMHSDGVIFVVSAFGDSPVQRGHLQRLLRLTGQRAIQWINLNKREVSLTTLLAEER
jgi:GxxExxY protein